MSGPRIYFKLNKLNSSGGIFEQKEDTEAGPHHAVSLVGWGFDESEQQEYWIGRNSWGT